MSSNYSSSVQNVESLTQEINIIFLRLFNQLIERRDALLRSLAQLVEAQPTRESAVEGNEVPQQKLLKFAGKFVPRMSKNKKHNSTHQNVNSPKQFKFKSLNKLQNMISKFGQVSDAPSHSKKRKQRSMVLQHHGDALSILTDTEGNELYQLEEARESEEAISARRELMREQDETFGEAALVDEVILREKREEQLKRIVSQENKLRELAMQEEYRRVAEGELPEEPEKGPEVSSIRFRFPSGHLANRRFLSSDRITVLFKFVHSKGFSPGAHRLMLNFPKKDLGDFDSSSSLRECGLSPQSMVYVEKYSCGTMRN